MNRGIAECPARAFLEGWKTKTKAATKRKNFFMFVISLILPCSAVVPNLTIIYQMSIEESS